MKKITILLILISFVFTSCSSGTSLNKEMNKAPKEYKSIDEFKSYMNELKGKSDEELSKQSEGISLKQYKCDFFFEPQKIPQEAVFKKINTRDVYIALLYQIDNNISELIPDDKERDINISLANEYATTIIYEWRCGSDEEGFKSFITSNAHDLGIKEVNIDGVQIYYYETTIEDMVSQMKASQEDSGIDTQDENGTIIRRDFEYMFDGNWIHVALPYSIPLEEVDKYIFVKKTFYKD